jgi:hypothetical protein
MTSAGARPDDPDRGVRILKFAVLVGGAGFALGFFGPMILDPSSGNGPMLGIFITGPIGFVVGLLWGLWRNRRGRHG